MNPGEYFLDDEAGDIRANAGRRTTTVLVRHTGDRPVQVGSHYHFFEVNPALRFDRAAASATADSSTARSTTPESRPLPCNRRKSPGRVELGGNRDVNQATHLHQQPRGQTPGRTPLQDQVGHRRRDRETRIRDPG